MNRNLTKDQSAQLRGISQNILEWYGVRGIKNIDHTDLYGFLASEQQELANATCLAESVDALGDILFLVLGILELQDVRTDEVFKVVRGSPTALLISSDNFVGLITLGQDAFSDLVELLDSVDGAVSLLSIILTSNRTKSQKHIPKGEKYSSEGKGPNYVGPEVDISALLKSFGWPTATEELSTTEEPPKEATQLRVRLAPDGFKKLALATAKQSTAKKRKVGAVVSNAEGTHFSEASNYNPFSHTCEDSEGKTLAEVVHAEVAAIDRFKASFPNEVPSVIYCTHQPCETCAKYISLVGITETVEVTDFMKFDTDKLRYDLIPTSSTKALAEVLTYGAKKYAPNNWRGGDQDRYIAAAFRHLEAWRGGEQNDSDSGLPHLAHLMTNVAFLLELDQN